MMFLNNLPRNMDTSTQTDSHVQALSLLCFFVASVCGPKFESSRSQA